MSLGRLSKSLTGSGTGAVTSSHRGSERPGDNFIPITYNNVTKSIRQWSAELNLSEATIRYRHRKGWAPGQILGLDPAPARDRTKEQFGRHFSQVVIVDDHGNELSRRDVAAVLKIKPVSLLNRLRRYRIADQVSQVTLDQLRQRARKI